MKSTGETMKKHLSIFNFSKHDVAKRDKLLQQAWDEGWTLEQLVKAVRPGGAVKLPVLSTAEQIDRMGKSLVTQLGRDWKKYRYVYTKRTGGRIAENIERLTKLYERVQHEMEWDESLLAEPET